MNFRLMSDECIKIFFFSPVFNRQRIFLIHGALIFIQLILASNKYMQNSNDQGPLPKTNGKTRQQYLSEIERSVLEKYPDGIYFDKDNNLQIKDLEQLEAEQGSSDRERGDGRGGNNAAQNTKKYLRAILESVLKDRFPTFDQLYFKGYNLKSQKEAYFLIFLFLHQFVVVERLPENTISRVIQLNNKKIENSIKGSQTRIDERPVFHQRNTRELRKYLRFNMDFGSEKRKFEEVEQYIRSLFLKKKSNAEKSIENVRKIIYERRLLKQLFSDIQPAQEANRVEEMMKVEGEDNSDQEFNKN